MSRLPLKPLKIAKVVGEVKAQAGEPGRVLVVGKEAGGVSSVGEVLGQGAAPAVSRNMVQTAVFDGDGMASMRAGGAAVVIVVAPTSELTSQWLRTGLAQLAAGGARLVLVLSRAPGVEVSLPAAGIGPKQVVCIAPDGRLPAEVLAEAVVEAAGDVAVALAAQLPSLREASCRQLIRRTARQNGLIGALFFIPGTDMPVMTLNEARLVLRIAAIYGEDIGTERALEILSVVGGGFGFRAVARQALDLLPGPGWVIKSGVAYGGTVAVGRAAIAYFEGPVRMTPTRLSPYLSPLLEKIKKLKSQA